MAVIRFNLGLDVGYGNTRNWAPKRSSAMQDVDLAGNTQTSGPGLTQRSRFPSTTAVPIPEISPEADTSCGHVKDRRLAAIGSLAPGLVAAILGAGLGLSFGHDELGYPACLAVTGALFWVFPHIYMYDTGAMGVDWMAPRTAPCLRLRMRGPEIAHGPMLTGPSFEMVGTAFFGYAPIVGLCGVGFAAALTSVSRP